MFKRQPPARAEIVRVNASPNFGLTNAQVSRRAENGWLNINVDVKTKSIGRILFEHTFTLFNFIIFGLAAAVIYVGAYKNALFALIMLANTLIGIVQELRTKRAMDELSLLNKSAARVMRDGAEAKIPTDQIAIDDIYLLRTGDAVAADSVMLSGTCAANESLLTGEADSVVKHTGDALSSGSFIVSGACVARVDRVGEDNTIAHMSNQAKQYRKPHSQILDAIRKVVRVLSIAIFPLGIFMFMRQSALPGATFGSAVVTTTASLVGMIPEGLALLTSTVMAISIIRLAQKRVMIQELHCVEGLARVDTLCLDKTGTLTSGHMTVEKTIPLDGAHESEINKALSSICACMDDGGATFAAIKRAFSNVDAWSAREIAAFSSEKKWSGAAFDCGAYAMGAPEFVMPDMPNALNETIAAFVGEYRVLLLARADAISGGTPSGVSPIALILISDDVRPQVAATLSYFAKQGVRVKVISGDNVVTVSSIARRAGMTGAIATVDARTLKTPEDLAQAVEKYDVFGRVLPDQKRGLVAALRSKGHTVAMTGDGVNDVMALREADVGIAVASGSDAARNVANIVLLDDQFDALPEVVAEGRRSINNLERSASLFLMRTIYSTALTCICLLLKLPFPFIPIQISLIGSLIIGTPAFILALEPNFERIRGDFLPGVLKTAAPAALGVVVSCAVSMLIGPKLSFTQPVISTICVYAAFFSGYAHILRISLPLTKLRGALAVAVPIGFAFCVTVLTQLFSLSAMGAREVIATACLSALAAAISFCPYVIAKLK